MARRGTALREHILLTAKDVFLEKGFERTSMDVVAERAATSKRSLYAHFATKDTLFLAVVDLVRGLYLDRIKTPDHYANDPLEAITLFCGRFLQMLLWQSVLRTCRMGIAEADRLPEAAAGYHETFFAAAHDRLAAFLEEHYEFVGGTGADLAHYILGRIAYPRLVGALFGVEDLLPDLPEEAAVATDVDLPAIRSTVQALLRLAEERAERGTEAVDPGAWSRVRLEPLMYEPPT